MADRISEGMKKIFLASVGAAATTAEKSKEVMDEFVKKGTMTVEQGKVPKTPARAKKPRTKQ